MRGGPCRPVLRRQRRVFAAGLHLPLFLLSVLPVLRLRLAVGLSQRLLWLLRRSWLLRAPVLRVWALSALGPRRLLRRVSRWRGLGAKGAGLRRDAASR